MGILQVAGSCGSNNYKPIIAFGKTPPFRFAIEKKPYDHNQHTSLCKTSCRVRKPHRKMFGQNGRTLPNQEDTESIQRETTLVRYL